MPCQSAPCRSTPSSTSSAAGWSPGAHRSAGCGLRGEPRRRQGSRPGHYTLPQCPDIGYQPSSAHLTTRGEPVPAVQPLPAAAGRPAQAHLWWSKAQSKHGNLLNGPQDEPAAHMAASLRPPGSHPIRLAVWHLGSSSSAAKGVMRTSRPVADKLGAVRQDPDLHCLLSIY